MWGCKKINKGCPPTGNFPSVNANAKAITININRAIVAIADSRDQRVRRRQGGQERTK